MTLMKEYVSETLMDFLGICTSGKYHRDMKIKAVLKQFRVYGIFKKITN